MQSSFSSAIPAGFNAFQGGTPKDPARHGFNLSAGLAQRFTAGRQRRNINVSGSHRIRSPRRGARRVRRRSLSRTFPKILLGTTGSSIRVESVIRLEELRYSRRAWFALGIRHWWLREVQSESASSAMLRSHGINSRSVYIAYLVSTQFASNVALTLQSW